MAFRIAAVTHFVRQHLPPPHGNPVAESALVPETALVPDQVKDAASFAGEQAVDLGLDGVRDAAVDSAAPDPVDDRDWLFDHDPFRPGIQLTDDPLAADVSGILGAGHLDLIDLPDDGLDTVLG